MSRKINFLRWSALVCGGALTLFGAAGCNSNYNPPQGDFQSNSFTERDRSQGDAVLRSLTILKLEDAQKIALLNNPNYIAAYHSVNAARMRYYQSFSTYLPTVTAEGSLGGANYDTHELYQTSANRWSQSGSLGLRGQWMIFDGLAREFGVMAAKHNYNNAVALDDDARRKLLLSVAQAYYDILLANEQRRIALEDMSFQLKNLRETEIKHQYGAVPLSDVLNFQIQVNQADSNRLNAEYSYSAALYTLAALMGYTEGTLPDEVKFPEIQTEDSALLLSVETFLDMALANRPDLKAYREQLEATEYGLYQTYSAYAPTVNLYGAINYGGSESSYESWGSDDNTRTSSESWNWNYGLTASWVLFDGFHRFNRTREMQSQVAVAEFSVAQSWLTVVNEVRTAYTNYDVNLKQANLYSDIRKLVFEQRDLVQAEYDAGQAEITRLNEAQRNVVSAEGNLVQALANVQKAKAQLQAAANINTLGRGYESIYGTAATIKVLQDDGMKPTADGLANAEELQKYNLKDSDGAAAQPAEPAEPAEPAKPAEIVGPMPKDSAK